MLDSVRLHISPFTPEVLPLILSSALQEVATGISFHEIPTFPERNFGFVTLPVMEAQRLRKKVNGSILRGTKVKVDEARPKKTAAKEVSDEEAAEVPAPESQERRMRKRKRQEGVIPAYELKEERKVKRGWTEPAAAKIKEKREKKGKDKSDQNAKKRQERSAYTDEAECLFKTEVPPNKQDLKSNAAAPKKKSSKQKSKVVHEFEHTEKHPSFLRSSAASDNKPTADYDEEKGWVDASGTVVEPKRTRSKRQAAGAPPSPSSDEAPAVDHERLGSLTLREQEGDDDDEETSSSGSSSSEAASEVSSSKEMAPPLQPLQRPSISISPAPEVAAEDTTGSAGPEPHPLEALYKKPALPSAAEKNKANLSVDPVPFSFFNSDDAPITASTKQSVETATLRSPPSAKPKRGAAARLPNLAIPPQTPYTQRDMSWRSQRSAAPTPDTAFPGGGWPNLVSRNRGSRVSTEEIEEEPEETDEVMASVEAAPAGLDEEGAGENEGDSDEENDDDQGPEADDTPIKKKGAAANDNTQSDFAREFYEKRGDFNRSWKQARREAGKAQRSAANRQKKG